MREVAILNQINHKSVAKIHDCFKTSEHVLIVMELASGGDLLKYLRKRRQLKESVAKSLFKQLIDAL